MSVEIKAQAWADQGRGDRRALALRDLLDELRQDRALYMAIAAYVLAAAVLTLAVGRQDHLVAFSYAPMLLRGGFAAVVVATLAIELPRAIAASPGAPLRALLQGMRSRITPRLIAGLVLFTFVALDFGAFTTIKTTLPSLTAFRLDVRAADLDARLHGGHDPWRLLQPLLGRYAVTRLIQFAYLPGWMLSLFGFTALLAVSRRLAHLRAQFFWTFVILWPLLGNLVAGLAPAAGPAFYPQLTGDGARYGPLLDYLSFSRGLAASSVDSQQSLWFDYQHDIAGLGSGISAFPSLHVAMATLFALVARRIDPRLGAAYVVFAVIIMAGSVHLAWHYAIDGYVSVVTTLAVWWAVGRVLRRRSVGEGLAAAAPQAVGNPLSRR
jgi:hypothetical protein